jgi:hypothetical protein
VRVVTASTRSFEPRHASRNPSPLPQLPQSIPPGRKQYRHVNGFHPDLGDACCARNLLAAQRDFCEQKGSLQEALEAGNQEVIFYPKFHCELNFVEHSGVQRNGIHKSIVITHWMACGRVFQLLSIPLRLRR